MLLTLYSAPITPAPANSTTPGREPRASLQKLLEEKKVGKILGFFETISSKKSEPTPAPDVKVVSVVDVSNFSPATAFNLPNR